MAIYNENEIKHGVSLPYIKINGITCTKNSVSVSLGHSVNKENISIIQSSVVLSDEHSRALGDEVTKLMYLKLKEFGYLVGKDV